MRKITVLLIITVAVAWSGVAGAQLSFDADFARDGIYESFWPLKAGQVVSVDIYVSNVPAPGLISMGFKLGYDASKLAVDGAAVDIENWPQGATADESQAGQVSFTGFRLEGLAGSHIRLGTISFRCLIESVSQLLMLKYGEGYSGFVLDCISEPCEPIDPARILDGDIGFGITLAEIRPAVTADANGNGAVDLADAILVLQMTAKLTQGYVHGNADIDGDGAVGIPEVIYIMQALSGRR